MSARLKGQFMGCPYHDDDHEACIQYSGQAPCDPPDGWQTVPVDPSWNMLAEDGCSKDHECIYHDNRRRIWRAMLKAAPKP